MIVHKKCIVKYTVDGKLYKVIDIKRNYGNADVLISDGENTFSVEEKLLIAVKAAPSYLDSTVGTVNDIVKTHIKTLQDLSDDIIKIDITDVHKNVFGH